MPKEPGDARSHGADPNFFDALEAARLLSPKPSVAEIARFSAQWGADAKIAISMRNLQERAKAKFQRADAMFFTKDALEMATHEVVAAYHATRFPTGAKVLDLTAGIGSDTIALARRGPVTAYEIDPFLAELARRNLAVHELAADVRCADGLSDPGANYVFADPMRRSEAGRTVDPNSFLPNPNRVVETFPGVDVGLLKLSPLMKDEDLLLLGTRVEFLSYAGECREALVYWGRDVQPGVFAIHLESGTCLERTDEPESSEPSEYLMDCDPAVVRAHASGWFAAARLGEHPGYLTSKAPLFSPVLKTYRILSALPADRKQTQAWLHSHKARVIEVKQRGAGLEAESVRNQLKPVGDLKVSLAAYRIGKSVRFLVLQRLFQESAVH